MEMCTAAKAIEPITGKTFAANLYAVVQKQGPLRWIVLEKAECTLRVQYCTVRRDEHSVIRNAEGSSGPFEPAPVPFIFAATGAGSQGSL